MASDKQTQTVSIVTDPIEATTWLQKGCVLAYPTESVWGIGCDPFNLTAVQTLLTLKSRPIDKGLIVITDDMCRIDAFTNTLTTQQQQQLSASWQANLQHSSQKTCANSEMQTNPSIQTSTQTNNGKDVHQQRQAHTWLLPLPEALPIAIPAWITGKHANVAVRVIAHPLIQQVCQHMVSAHNPYGFVVSTSCNPAGKPPATTLLDAMAYFADSDLANHIRYLQGDTLGYTLPSQIGDISTGKVLR